MMSLDLKLALSFLSFLSCLIVVIVLESFISNSPSKLELRHVVYPKLSSSIALTSPNRAIEGAKYTAAESTQSRQEGVNQASFPSERNSENAQIRPATPIHPKKHEHVSFKIIRPVNWHPISTVDPYHVIPDQHKNVSAVAKSIYFSVKTTQRNHATRLPALLLTWMQSVHANQVHIVTDSVNPAGDEWINVAKKHGFDVSLTACLSGHSPWHLCCKSGYEFDGYYKSRAMGTGHKWFCHFDDDVYVNVPTLASTLEAYSPTEDSVYIGRWGELQQRTAHRPTISQLYPQYHRVDYRFAVGAGYCISDVLMSQLEKYLRGDVFRSNCVKLKMADNILVGVIIESVLGYSLIHSKFFNSHYNLQVYSQVELKDQVTISYLLRGTQNYIILPNATFTKERDPTRFFSYHCYLYPQTEWCMQNQ